MEIRVISSLRLKLGFQRIQRGFRVAEGVFHGGIGKAMTGGRFRVSMIRRSILAGQHSFHGNTYYICGRKELIRLGHRTAQPFGYRCLSGSRKFCKRLLGEACLFHRIPQVVLKNSLGCIRLGMVTKLNGASGSVLI